MVPYTKKKSAAEVVRSRIQDVATLEKIFAVAHFHGKKIVFTNGCFDILHRGHLEYLEKASDLGDELYVAVNSDASVKRQNKGGSRPIQDEETRALLIASLHFVTGVTIFDEDTPLSLITRLKPDVLVKGADYDENETDPKSKKYIVGSAEVKKYGGSVKTIQFLEGFSTTAIEKKIKAA